MTLVESLVSSLLTRIRFYISASKSASSDNTPIALCGVFEVYWLHWSSQKVCLQLCLLVCLTSPPEVRTHLSVAICSPFGIIIDYITVPATTQYFFLPRLCECCSVGRLARNHSFTARRNAPELPTSTRQILQINIPCYVLDIDGPSSFWRFLPPINRFPPVSAVVAALPRSASRGKGPDLTMDSIDIAHVSSLAWHPSICRISVLRRPGVVSRSIVGGISRVV